MSDIHTQTMSILLCKKCGLYKSADRKVVGQYPAGICNIAFVGEAPGEQENISGKPFVGASGQFLRAEIDKAGIMKFAILNAVKCHPPENRPPTDEEIRKCHIFLSRQLRTLRPKVIVLLGRSAFKAVMGYDCKVTEMAGKIRRVKSGARVVVLPHPAAILRNRPAYIQLWNTGIELIKRLVKS